MMKKKIEVPLPTGSINDGGHTDIMIIHALLNSLFTIFTTMMNTKIQPGVPVPKLATTAMGEVTALIGMTAPGTSGSVAVTLPMSALSEISRRLLGFEITDINKDATDLTGELTNMLVGGAKRILSEKGLEFDMQIPQLITGDGHVIEHHHSGQTVLLPVKLGESEFYVELNFV
jgi:chemotaxis protein CheX